MKKIYSLLLVVVMLLSLCACDSNSNSTTNEETEQKSNEALEKCPEDKNGIHDWDVATCVEPAKCYNCGVYKDDKLGNRHIWEEGKCLDCGILYDDYINGGK